MLNGDGNGNGKKLIDLIRKKNKFTRAAHFFVHFFAVILYNYNAVLHD